MKQSLKSL